MGISNGECCAYVFRPAHYLSLMVFPGGFNVIVRTGLVAFSNRTMECFAYAVCLVFPYSASVCHNEVEAIVVVIPSVPIIMINILIRPYATIRLLFCLFAVFSFPPATDPFNHINPTNL